jgi:hypothetical protein
MNRPIHAIFAALAVLAVSPISSNADYMISDSINNKQDIKFNWTFDGQDRQGGFTYTFTVEGGQPQNGAIVPATRT